MIRFRKFELVPSVLTLIGVGMMFALGVWQVQRLEWKNTLIAEIESAQNASATRLESSDSAPLPALEYQKVEAYGQFIEGKEIFLMPRYHRGALGYAVIAPFKLLLKDGSNPVFLVNRGWIPTAGKAAYKQQAATTHPLVQVEGMMVKPTRKGLFTPDNNPEKNIWFWLDMPRLETHTGLTLMPMMIEATSITPGNGETLAASPILSDGKINLRNDHLGYAITWFLIALGGVVIFLLYHRAPASR